MKQLLQLIRPFREARNMVALCLAFFLCAGGLWAQTTVTWPGTTALPGTATSVANDENITIAVSSTNTYTNPIRVYANTTVTISALNGARILGITYEASSTGNYVTYAQEATVTPEVTPTVSGKFVTWTYDASDSVTEFTFKPSAQTRCNGISITYAPAGSSVTLTTVTIDATNLTNTDVFVSSEAGSLGATVYAGDQPLDDATVTWTSDNANVATINAAGVVTLVAAGSATITASYAGVEDLYGPSTATYTLNVTNSNPNAPGTQNNPYTVAQARAAIDANAGITGVYATGIVTEIPTAYNSQFGNITFNMKDEDGTEVLQAYRCVGATGVDASTVAVGDVAVVYGNLIKYNTTYEFSQGCELVSLTHPVITNPTITVADATVVLDAEEHDGTLDLSYANLTISSMEDFAVQFYDANNEEVSDPDWIEALVAEQDPAIGEGYVVSYYVLENEETTPRTAYFKVFALGDDIVYSNLVTVTQTGWEPPHHTWDLSIDQTATATATEMTWTSDFATMEVAKGSASTATNNYYPGTSGQSYTSTRFYKNSNLTITPVPGYAITNVVFTATTLGYANALKSSTWTNATASLDSATVTVTVTPTDGTSAMLATIGGTCGFTAVTVYYEENHAPAITVDNNVDIDYDATGGSISYTISNPTEDGVMTATANADWITLESPADNAVAFTCDANEETQARTATVTLTYTYNNATETISKEVIVTQGAAPEPVVLYTSIPDLFTGATSTEKSVLVNFGSWIVSGVSTNGKNVYVTDGTFGFVMYYNSDMSETYSAGDILEGEEVSCKLKLYNGFAELLNVNADDLTITPDAAELTPADVEMSELTGMNTGALVHYENLTCSVENNKYYLSDSTTTLQVYSAIYAFGSTLVADHIYNITGIYQQYTTNTSDTREVLPRSADDIEEVIIQEPSVTVTPATVDVNADEHDGTLDLAYENLEISDMSDFGVQFYDIEGEEVEEPDWVEVLVAEQDPSVGEGYVVSYYMLENEGEARTAYFKVFAIGDDDFVYSNLVTVNQAAYVADYATLPFEFDGGKDDIETTAGLTQDGLDSDYGSSPKLKFNTTGDWLVLHFNEEPGKLTFNIKGNSFSGSTFTVQTSVDGETYTDLETYTALDNNIIQDEEFNNLDADVRYIRWIYTEKASGNVALGNIKLENVPTDPFVSVEETQIEVGVEGGEGSIVVTYLNIDEPFSDIQFYDADGETEIDGYDWIDAEIDDDNNVYYLVDANDGEARTAYLKVYNLVGGTYFVYSDLITITQAAYVAPPTGDEYVLFTDSLVEGDYVICYANPTWTAAMKDTVVSGRLSYEEVTPYNGEIITEDATIVWHIAPSGDYWTIYSADANAYAAGTGVKNKAQMLGDGTDDMALWTITPTGDGYDIVNKGNEAAGVNAYLRNNTTYGFACYAEGTGGALSLYKKVTSTPECTVALDTVESFETYTDTTARWTGYELPGCWTVAHHYTTVDPDTVAMIYYKPAFAGDGSYSLRLHHRGIVAMPALPEDVDFSRLQLNMSVRQSKLYYKLQVGVMTDLDGDESFVPVALCDNGTTNVEEFKCNFANYTAPADYNGPFYIAFKNIGKSSSDPHSVNYLDEVMLSYADECAITELDHFEDFEEVSFADDGRMVPACWTLPDAYSNIPTKYKPQLYEGFATTGIYSLRMRDLCTFVMPEYAVENTPIQNVKMTFSLRQPNKNYRLEVGVMTNPNDTSTFVLVKRINNHSTGIEPVEVSFANYVAPEDAEGLYIAFRNVGYSAAWTYSYNYIDSLRIFEVAANNDEDTKIAETEDDNAFDVNRYLENITIYPNPTRDYVNVQCIMDNVQYKGIEVIDVYGKVVRNVVGANDYSPLQTRIDVSGLAAGMYFVRVTTDKGAVTKPFVKR